MPPSSIKTLIKPPTLEKYPSKIPTQGKKWYKISFGIFCLVCIIRIIFHSQKTSSALENKYYLKSPLPDFVGRQKYLNLLDKELVASKRDRLAPTKIKVLWGKGGYGKSEIAIEFANRHLSDFSLIWTFCCDREENAYQSYHSLAERLNLLDSKESLDQLKKKVHSYLQTHSFSRPWLLIFDNVEEELKDYPVSGGVILVTSQKKILNPECLIEVKPFSEEESVMLLEKISKEKRGAPMVQLARDLEGIPLLLNYAAHYIKATPGCNTEDYLHLVSSHLHEKEGPLWREMDINRRYLKSLSASWQFPLRSLEKECPLALKWLFICGYLYPEHISEDWMIEWLVENRPSGEKTLEQEKADLLKALQMYGIIRYESDTKTFSIHRFFQLMLQDSRKGQLHEDIRQAVSLLAKHAKDYKFSDTSSWKKGQLWYLHACEVRKWLRSSLKPMRDENGQLSLFYEGIGNWCVFNEIQQEALTAYYQALELRKAGVPRIDTDIGRTYKCIGWTLYQLSHYQEALEACVKAEKLQHDTVGEEAIDYANILNVKGVTLSQIGEDEKGLACHLQALKIRLENLGAGPVDIENDLAHLTFHACSKGKHSKLLKKLEQRGEALALHEKVVDVGRSLNNAAICLNKLGHPIKALEFSKRATEVYLASCGKENPLYIWSLMREARCLISLEQYQNALKLFQQAQQLNLDLRGKKHGDLSSPLEGIGRSYFYLKKYKLSRKFFKKALRIGKFYLGDNAFIVIRSYNGLGWCYLRDNQVQKGFKYLLKYLELSAEVYHNTPAMVVALGDFQKALKEASELEGETETVKQAADKALEISKMTLGKEHPLTQDLKI